MKQLKLIGIVLLLFVSAISAEPYLGIVEVFFSPGKNGSIVASKIDEANETINYFLNKTISFCRFLPCDYLFL